MRLRHALMVMPILFATACLVGPNYRRPSAPVPQGFKEMPKEGTAAAVTWKAAQPNDAARRGKWWEIFRDPDLNALEEEVGVSNQTIAVAEAQYRGARALVGNVRSALFPAVGVGASVTRSSGGTSTAIARGRASRPGRHRL